MTSRRRCFGASTRAATFRGTRFVAHGDVECPAEHSPDHVHAAGRETRTELFGHEALDVLGPHLIEAHTAEGRNDM